MRKNKYMVTVAQTTFKSYEVTGSDEEAAKFAARARCATGATPKVLSEGPLEITNIRKVSPRYYVEVTNSGRGIVIDTEMGMVVSDCYSKGVADITAKALNEEEKNDGEL